MSVRSGESPAKGSTGGSQPPTAQQRLFGLAIVAVVVIVVVIVTRSADAVAVAVPALLLLLGWVSTGRIDRGGPEGV
jgi:hypothetical protein